MSFLEPVFEALNRGQVRYVVVGGVAVVLHGHARLTANLDLIVDLDPLPATAAVEAMLGLGLRARAPVDPRLFADSTVRAGWIREKGMRVFTFWNPLNPMLVVDIFAEHPMPFDGLWSRSLLLPMGGVPIRIASIRDLVELKRQAGRPQDLSDIGALEAIERRRGGGHGGA
ncbi:MAG: hypothetical protein HYZ53_04475 [Planctomycetes bacterium]|nr:hypothetical protein [Planctomycetota bacterium]